MDGGRVVVAERREAFYGMLGDISTEATYSVGLASFYGFWIIVIAMVKGQVLTKS